jgi:hypothetical protein
MCLDVLHMQQLSYASNFKLVVLCCSLYLPVDRRNNQVLRPRDNLPVFHHRRRRVFRRSGQARCRLVNLVCNLHHNRQRNLRCNLWRDLRHSPLVSLLVSRRVVPRSNQLEGRRIIQRLNRPRRPRCSRQANPPTTHRVSRRHSLHPNRRAFPRSR